MLPFQVGAIELNRLSAGSAALWKRAVRLNRPYLRELVWWLSVLLVLTLFSAEAAFAAKPKMKKQKIPTPTPSVSPSEQSLTNIPLPIGHEAKGLVLPDFDAEGHLRGRFEAMSAKRLDEEHIGFHGLKILTYTAENQPDLTVELSESVFNLKTRVLSSNARTTIKRADFNIAGDSVEFDTNSHTGKLVGNVKMVITSQSQLLGNQNE